MAAQQLLFSVVNRTPNAHVRNTVFRSSGPLAVNVGASCRLAARFNAKWVMYVFVQRARARAVGWSSQLATSMALWLGRLRLHIPHPCLHILALECLLAVTLLCFLSVLSVPQAFVRAHECQDLRHEVPQFANDSILALSTDKSLSEVSFSQRRDCCAKQAQERSDIRGTESQTPTPNVVRQHSRPFSKPSIACTVSQRNKTRKLVRCVGGRTLGTKAGALARRFGYNKPSSTALTFATPAILCSL
jgi:hypothetical protein